MTHILLQLIQIIPRIIYLSIYTIYICLTKPFRWCFPKSLKSLEGEVILITGAGNGIGRQLALKLVEIAPSSKLICWDINSKGIERTMSAIHKDDPHRVQAEVYTYQVDVSNQEEVRQAAKRVRQEVGQVTVIINNAGICPSGPFLLQTPETLQNTFGVNIFAHFWILHEFLPYMIRTNHGHIVTMASIASWIPMNDITSYVASKHALHGFIESLKRELKTYPGRKLDGINFTTVYPPWVQTSLTQHFIVKPRFPIFAGTLLSPEYVAQRTIEGFRRNEEYVHIPWFIKDVADLCNLLPFETQQKLRTGLLHFEFEHQHLDPEMLLKYQNMRNDKDEEETESCSSSSCTNK